MAQNVNWTVTKADISLGKDANGKVSADVPLKADGVVVAHLIATMTKEGHLRVEYQALPGAPALAGLEMWSNI